MKLLKSFLLVCGFASAVLFGQNHCNKEESKSIDTGIFSEVQEKMHAESLLFCELSIDDFDMGFKETLAALKPVDIHEDQIGVILSERQSQGIKSFVLKKDGRVVATASILFESKFYRGGQKAAHVEDVAVHPDYQGHGFGKVIMACLTREAALSGCYKIILDCSEKNVPFYEKSGFKKNDFHMRLDLDH